LRDVLAAALADELPLSKADGGFVRAGYDADLDAARKLRDDSRQVIAGLQSRYADETGIRALKIKHNNMLGYFIEVPASHGEKLLAPEFRASFIHRQTMAGAMRFATTELGEIEGRIASAGDRALSIELAIFDRLTQQVLANARPLEAVAERSRASTWRRALPNLRKPKTGRGPRSTIRLPSSLKAAAIRSWKHRCASTAGRSCRTTPISLRPMAVRRAASGS
jgi:hypothetical protein